MKKSQKGRPGNSGPAGFAFYMPKASARKLHQRNGAKTGGRLSTQTGKADFFGASSVASALGIRCGRDPAADRRLARSMPCPNQKKLQLRPPLRTQGPRPPQACHRGASPRRILVSLGGLLIV